MRKEQAEVKAVGKSFFNLETIFSPSFSSRRLPGNFKAFHAFIDSEIKLSQCVCQPLHESGLHFLIGVFMTEVLVEYYYT